MRISRSLTRVTLSFTDEERKLFTNHAFMQFNLNGVDNFLVLSNRETDFAKLVGTFAPYTSAGHSWQIVMALDTPKWRFLNNLPKFGGEQLVYTTQEHSSGVILTAARPSMSTPPVVKGGRKPKEAPPVTPTLQPLIHLPVVAPSPPKATLQEASTLVELRHAVHLINKAKAHYGDALFINLNQDGTISLLLEVK